VVLIGVLRNIRRERSLLDVVLITYMVILLLYPFPSPRYVYPLLPIIYLRFSETIEWGVAALRAEWAPRWSRRLVEVSVGALIIANLVQDYRNVLTPVKDRVTDITIGASWIAEHSDPTSVVMAENPISVALYTKRSMLYPPPADNMESSTTVGVILASQATHILVAPPLQTPRTREFSDLTRAIEAAAKSDPSRFRLVYANVDENVRVYEVCCAPSPQPDRSESE
jgi:hypothetical protein